MSRSPCFQYLVAMSFRSPWVGGRGQRRGFANGGSRGRLVSGDSHFRSVRDTNHGLRQGNFPNQSSAFQPPLYNNNNDQNRQLRPPPPYHQNQQFRPPPSYNRNPQFRRPPLQFDQNPRVRPRPRPPKPLDYRNWEYAKKALPPDSERFVILSYNILADYLALSHRKLYFHIPWHVLDWEWRKKNILFELGLWSADIICFQEVDRFQDLEVELKLRGYCGIWKMRTGNAIDGCAIFWRASRFKLLYEEGIEFNKLGLRDNVAQICVFELLSQNCSEDPEAPLKSSAQLNKVVVCNIHVLYNPKRGEIKLGQIRTLIEKAHAVSKIWNDAPVVLSGDFNCTPKSSLYNFIVEQKLDLSSVDRDKVSGQASAEIRTPPKPYPRVQADSSIPVPSTVGSGEVGISPRDLLSDNLKCDEDGNAEVYTSVNSTSWSQSTGTVLDVSDKTGCNLKYPNKDSTDIEVNKESQQTLVDGCKGETGSAFFIPTDRLKDSTSCFQIQGKVSTNQDQINEENRKLSHPRESCLEDDSQVTELGFGDKANTSTDIKLGSMSEHSDSNKITENKSMNCNNSTISQGSDCPSSVESNSEFLSASNSQYPVEVSSASTSIDFVLVDKLENLSLQELDEPRRDGGDETTEELGELADDLTPTPDSEAIDMEKSTYDPSSWTAMEIATATGKADCTLLEHPLQLRSTYTEVEDCAGARDSNGEPMVTSYNRCFMGTVDYIWRSEGLQTVRVLAPIPKHAMQWTSGFPTKKWGSDHIALVSELAFIKD